MPDFPILDSDRAYETAEFNRFVMDVFGNIEPRIDETDDWCTMPVRLVHDQAADWHLEIGPYSLDRCDIHRLQAAITAYCHATGDDSMRVVK